ncbi:unnamed protein product [Prorocentrum cordatum]|uniref:Phospholipase B-like n=1 Tax=Prorocentrum cordatum TaxID=2364126 RepID=A0ABN9XIH5_9DINO|nr:unnamed protein product [Polarella glacialis]
MHDGQLLSVTDSVWMLTVDPVSLNVTGKQKWNDSGIQDKFSIPAAGSAHPEWNKKYSETIDFVGNENPLTGATDIVIYGMSDVHKDSRKKYGATAPMKSTPYMHSFGITNNYTILPRMPVKFSLPLSKGKSMSESFSDLPLPEPSEDNAFWLVPLDGGDVIKKFLPVDEKLYSSRFAYSHRSAQKRCPGSCPEKRRRDIS